MSVAVVRDASLNASVKCVQEAVRGEFPEIVQLLLQNGARVCENHKLINLQVPPPVP
jgi:hypothetical protein